MLLAAALAVRATRFGHVRLELGEIAGTVAVEGADATEVAELPWPALASWLGRIGSSPLSAPGGPLALEGSALYLARYRAYEEDVAFELRRRLLAPTQAPPPTLEAVLDLLVPSAGDGEADRQRLGVLLAQLRPATVIAGGPGTGKTWTIARVIAASVELAAFAGWAEPEVAVAAPTGKAAKRITEQLHAARAQMEALGAPSRVGEALHRVEGMTLHRLLGWHPERGRFRHRAESPLPHDLVIVDETSMVSLSMMARVLDAVRPQARLVLVGDPGQLASIEAGTVLADIVGPAADGRIRLGDETLSALGGAPGPIPVEERSGERGGPGDGIVVLRKPRRFGAESPIALLAAAVRAGDPAATVTALGGEGVRWIGADGGHPTDLEALHPSLDRHLAGLREAGSSGDAEGALHEAGRVAVLCAHHRGSRGVEAWTRWSEERLRHAAGVHSLGMWYPGRPVMVTANDYLMDLFNGDIGVAVAGPDGLRVAFEGPDGPRLLAPTRLSSVTTVFAMTIHKSQGSEFDEVVVVLPDAGSPLATRELLYTGFTRARQRLTVVGSEEALVAALERRVARASGLGPRIWGSAG